jgi:hypothetical protein
MVDLRTTQTVHNLKHAKEPLAAFSDLLGEVGADQELNVTEVFRVSLRDHQLLLEVFGCLFLAYRPEFVDVSLQVFD